MPGMFETAGAAGDAYVLIWTTTPWTLPANTAVSLAPDADYVMVQADGSNMIMARELVEQVAEIAGWESYDLVRGEDGEPVALKGREFTGLTYTCPCPGCDLKGTIIYGDHVTLDSGTGAVHTAPGHGQDDYPWRWSSTCRCSCRWTTTAFSPTRRALSRASTLTRRTRSSSNGCANAARWWPKRRSCTATRTLALPRAGHLPRHRPVVRVHGQEQPARERAQGHRERRRVDSRVGFEPYRIHGGRPSRLVHLAPAFVGAHPRVQCARSPSPWRTSRRSTR